MGKRGGGRGRGRAGGGDSGLISKVGDGYMGKVFPVHEYEYEYYYPASVCRRFFVPRCNMVKPKLQVRLHGRVEGRGSTLCAVQGKYDPPS